MHGALLPLLAAVIGLQLPAARADTIPIGYLTALKGTREKLGLTISGAISYAVEQINNRTDLLAGHTLDLTYAQTDGNTRVGTRRLTEMICNGTVAFFGPEESCLIEANVAAAFDLPMISYKCADDAVSNKDEFPNFARTYPPETQVTKSVVALLRYYDWNKFSIIATETPQLIKIADSLQELAESNKMTINHKVVVPNYDRCCRTNAPCCDPQTMPNIVKKTKDGTRIYVFLGSPLNLRELLFTMSLFGLLDGRYMVIYIDLDFAYSSRHAAKYMWRANKMWELIRHQDYQCQATDIEPLRSLLVVLATPPQQDYVNFTERVREYNAKPPFNFKPPDWSFKKHIGVFAGYLYDSVMMYAKALNRTIADNPGVSLQRILVNGSQIVARIRNQTFMSVMGSVIKMDDNGDSEGNFTVLALRGGCDLRIRYGHSHNFTLSCDQCMKTIGKFYLTNKSLPEFRLDPGKTVNWKRGVRPNDEPLCGFDGMKCYRPEDDTRKISAGVLGLVVLLATLVMFSVYRVWKEEQKIVGLLWKIYPDQLEETGQQTPGDSSSKLSIASIASFESKGFGQIFTTTVRFRGNLVRVQNLNFSKKVDISREMMKEMRIMRELGHQNVNQFFGAVVEPTRVRLVSDYCNRGSLPDILEGGDLNLEYMFIAELIRDLVKGMLYLHTSALLVHGNLKSSNCVVSSRWVLKVTDFGLHELRQTAHRDGDSDYQYNDYQYYKSQLWKSPELLRRPLDSPRGTQAGDVYAFGIILQEILCREGPFGGACAQRMEPQQIVGQVQRVPGPDEVPFRPPTDCLRPPPDMAPELEKLVADCMQQCWQESEAARPTFIDIKKMLQPLRAGLSANLVNQMMEKMEKYANNLEDLVRERTHLLNEEKQKTEALLYRMLPPPVAFNLTRGIPVQPETFDSVTIYFSDIVGFTQISADSTPLQVVELLNDLYTLFDDIIRGYDVYKVETIGDAYMVVSGVPERNGIRHAGEIASMALSLLEAIQKHTIQHRPGEQLKLRIGVHTGQVVAGVVGLTMPRYCLFGDTVNTASRIESTGEPLRVHISDRCQRTLTQLGGYHTVPRGAVPMKGKGLVETHWLLRAGAEAVQRKRVDLPALPPLFSRAGGCHGSAAPPRAASVGVLSVASARTRASAPPGRDSCAVSRAGSRVGSRAASPGPEPAPRRPGLPAVCRRPLSLPSVRESRSLDNVAPPLRLAAPRRRDSRSATNCRDLRDLCEPRALRDSASSGALAESARPMLGGPPDAPDAPLQPAGDSDREEGGEAAPPADQPPAWDCLKDWCRRFFSRHRLEPPMPLNAKLKHNGYSLHSSRDTVV